MDLLIRVVVTSTPVEMAFSRMTALTSSSHQCRVGRHALSAKMCTYTYEKQVSRWRAEELQRLPRKTSRLRPDWTKTRNPGSNVNALHLFIKKIRLYQTMAKTPHGIGKKRINDKTEHTIIQ